MRHLRQLRRLTQHVRFLDEKADAIFSAWQQASQKSRRTRLLNQFKRLDKKLQAAFPRFHYKQKVLDEMVLVTENIRDKIAVGLRTIEEFEAQRKVWICS